LFSLDIEHLLSNIFSMKCPRELSIKIAERERFVGLVVQVRLTVEGDLR